MQRLIEFMEHYLLRSLIPFVVVVGISFGVLLAVLYGIAVVEHRAGRPGPFDVEVPQLGDAPLWIILVMGLLLANGVVMSQLSLFSILWGRRRREPGYKFDIPFPLGRLAAMNVTYVGAAGIAFFALRQLLA